MKKIFLNSKIQQNKKTNKNGKIKNIGEFVDGKWNGKGKEYFQNNKIKFAGEFLNGKIVT